MHCTQCGSAISPDARFCGNCGTRIEATPVAPRPRETGAERRLMTVLFCDLVGSTQISTGLDPEEMHEIVLMYQTVCGREVGRYDGYIAQYQGDGIVVYFGYPKARSDAAERAVLAGLKMRDAVQRLSDEIASSWGVELSVRIGVHSGVVVVGEMVGSGHSEKMALGDTPNIASRIQGQALENEVMISEATARLAANRFVTENRGTPALKGVTEQLELYVVTSVDSRAFWRRQTNQHIFGRDAELDLLGSAFAKAQSGHGQLVEITGETGVGKSQLLWHFASQVDAPIVDITCRDFQQRTPLGPFADWLLRVLGTAEISGEAGIDRLRSEVERLALGEDVLPGLCALLDLSHADLPPDPAAARTVMLDAVCKLLLQQGGIVVVDDAHLSDASTLEILNLLAERLNESELLLLVGGQLPVCWSKGSEPAERCRLQPLDRDASAALVRAYLGEDAPEPIITDLLERADGMPIFLVELAQTASQKGLGGNNDTAIPTSLQGLLMNRLDDAGDAKRIAQEAAVLGREFEHSELKAVTLQLNQSFEIGLAKLVDMGLVDQNVTATGLRYIFRHQLMRDLAYDSILKRTRAQLHRRISNYLQEQMDSDAGAKRQHMGRIAQHYLRSLSLRQSTPEDLQKGVQLLMQSAAVSLGLGAYIEAEADVNNARELCARLPDTRDRWRLETDIHNQLSVIHRATIGFGASEVEVDLRNARTASEKLGDSLQVATVSLAIWSLLLGRGSYGDALEVAEATRDLSTDLDDADIKLRALAACGNTEFWLGRPAAAYDYCKQVLAAYGTDHEGRGLLEHGWDAGVHANQQAIWSAWLIGRSDVLELEARLHSLAERIGHPLTTAMAENASCMLHVLRRDADAALAAAERLGAVADQFGLGFFQMFAALFRAEALARRDEFGEAFEQADRLFRTYQEHMGGLAQTFVGAFMARVYAGKGDLERARFTVEHALKAVEQCDERVFETSLRRQAAHLASGDPIDLSEIELCGDLDASGTALSAEDPRNSWIV